MDSNWKYWLAMMAIGATVSCGDDNTEDPGDIQPEPSLGQSSFVSADGRNGEASQENERGGDGNNLDAAAEDDNMADGREAEEGDIYRVSETEGLILNLNAYRGLQIIDFNDPTSPEIIGRAQISGEPVEMYQVGDRVYILMNNWWGYYGSRSNIATNQYNGGVVAVVDISDVRNPKIMNRAQVPGYIRTSRLTRGGGDESLYVAANDWSTDTTYIKSFSVSENGQLVVRSQIDLDGNIADIQATGDHLMVSRWDWHSNTQGSDVALIDISNPNGTMVEGQSVKVKGRVAKKSDMSIQDGILRVVSGNTWSSNTNTNHVETFDASDISNITKIDGKTFGEGEQLFATLFLEDSAFFVTYEQVDPFHAFSISDAGMLVEESEFIVSGFNTWFKTVSDSTRLIGIGINDENNNRAPAVSLYDITDLTNANPLVDRDELPLDWSWSEANWDDRAFSVLENAANVAAPTGEMETGLVLLPFSGWDDKSDSYLSGVQIFTFSDTTVTLRGTMMHDTPVRRTFMADSDEDLTGNMSEMELSLFDTTDVDSPSEVSRLELAPNFSDMLIFGDHALRRHDRSGYWGWWGRNTNTAREDVLQVVSLSEHPDSADKLAEISIPANSEIYKKGDSLLVVSSEYSASDDISTTVTAWDLSDPKAPVMGDTLVTNDLPAVHNYDYWGWEDCFDCSSYYYYGGQDQADVVGDALVFHENTRHEEKIGTRHVTSTYSSDDRWEECYSDDWDPKACSYVDGYRECSYVVRTDGTQTAETCRGEFFACTQDTDGQADCDAIDQPTSGVQTNTYDYDETRYWNERTFHVLDASNINDLKVANEVATASDEEAVNTIVEGDKLHFTFKQPHRVPNDNRDYVKYHFRTLDFANPSMVAVGSDVNIPGELVEIDGNTLLTRDFLWGSQIIESSINRLELRNGAAYLRGIKRFRDKIVDNVMLNGADQVLVTHQTAWYVNYQDHGYEWDAYDQTSRMTILNTTGRFTELSEFDVDRWATLQAAVAGRAIFDVPGGVLIVNTNDAANPYAQAFFPMRGWSHQFSLDGDSAYVAAGLYGLYEFDINTFNLLQLP